MTESSAQSTDRASATTSDVGILSKEMILEAARRPQHPTRKARLGFIGAGWWATTNHMPLLAARSDIVMTAVCGVNPEVLSRVRDAFGFTYATSDFRDLLAQDLDAVIVASPHRHHAEHTRAALEARCHVLVEKPMCTDAGDARRLVALAQAQQRHLLVSYGWHHRPLSIQAKQLMNDGAVGTVEHVACHMGSPSKEFFMGTKNRFGIAPLVEPELENYADPELSQGGYGQAQLSHALGLLTWLTDLEPKTVFAAMSTGGARIDLHNAVTVQFHGGAIASISGTGSVPIGARFQLDFRIFGDEGALIYDIDRARLAVFRHDGANQEVTVAPDDGAYRCDGPPHQLVELALGISDQNSSPGDIGRRAVEIVHAAYQSNCRGTSVSVDELVS